MMQEQFDAYMQNKLALTYSHNLLKVNSKWIVDLNTKFYIIILGKANVEHNFVTLS